MWLNFTLVPAEQDPYCQSPCERGHRRMESRQWEKLWPMISYKKMMARASWSSTVLLRKVMFFLHPFISWHANTAPKSQHSNESCVQTRSYGLQTIVGHTPGRAVQVPRRQGMCCPMVLHLSITGWDEIVTLVIPLRIIQGDVNSLMLPQQHMCCDLSPDQDFSLFPTETQHQPRAATKINSALSSELRALTETAANSTSQNNFWRKSHFVSLLSYGDFLFHSAQRFLKVPAQAMPTVVLPAAKCSALTAHTGLFSCPSTFLVGLTKW